MVDVGGKAQTRRRAIARGRVRMGKSAFEALATGRLSKGDALAVARLAGILAAKKTPELVPLAHPIRLESVAVECTLDSRAREVVVTAEVSTSARTGVEMEALTAVTVAALTLYDMLKAVDRGMVMGEFAVWEKRGGRSGVFRRRP